MCACGCDARESRQKRMSRAGRSLLRLLRKRPRHFASPPFVFLRTIQSRVLLLLLLLPPPLLSSFWLDLFSLFSPPSSRRRRPHLKLHCGQKSSPLPPLVAPSHSASWLQLYPVCALLLLVLDLPSVAPTFPSRALTALPFHLFISRLACRPPSLTLQQLSRFFFTV